MHAPGDGDLFHGAARPLQCLDQRLGLPSPRLVIRDRTSPAPDGIVVGIGFAAFIAGAVLRLPRMTHSAPGRRPPPDSVRTSNGPSPLDLLTIRKGTRTTPSHSNGRSATKHCSRPAPQAAELTRYSSKPALWMRPTVRLVSAFEGLREERNPSMEAIAKEPRTKLDGSGTDESV